MRFAQRFVLYGEWLAATHSVAYEALPHEFLGFDVWDRAAGRFSDRAGTEAVLAQAGLCGVPVVAVRGVVPEEAELRGMVQRGSAFGGGRGEGVVVKIEVGGWVWWRGKVVRGDFVVGGSHWSRNVMRGWGGREGWVCIAIRVAALWCSVCVRYDAFLGSRSDERF